MKEIDPGYSISMFGKDLLNRPGPGAGPDVMGEGWEGLFTYGDEFSGCKPTNEPRPPHDGLGEI